MWRLADHPDHSLPLLRRQLRPVPALPPGRIAGWVRDLDADDFQVRETAARELEKAGDLAETALRKAEAETSSLEVRRRVERLLGAVERGTSPDALRQVRAVEVLEHAGTAEARELLEVLSRGAAEARATREARAALIRLERRPGIP